MTDTDIQMLLDRAAIQEVRVRIAQALDERDWALFEDQFADDVAVDFADMGVPTQWVTRQALRADYQQNLSRTGLRTQHLFTNFRITVDGDAAHCRSSFVGQHFLVGAEGGEEFVLHGEYRDTLQRTLNGWKISTVTFRIAYQSGNAALLIP